MKDDAVNPLIRKFVRDQKDITIDRYSDKGAYGELYFGERVVFGDRVAMKFYELDDKGSGHEEAKLLQRIKHDNILPIIDARIIHDKIAYYLTPEMSGGDLQNVLDKYIIPTDIAITVCKNILQGLNELHKEPNTMVHRDLKTYNILVDLEDGVKTYLADFGTIKKIQPNNSSVTASKYTILYRTPEALGSNEHSIRSDIYQVGIILYQLLGGLFPMKNPELWLKGRKRKKFDSLEPWQKQGFLINHINELVSKGKLLNLDSLPEYVPKKMKGIIRAATKVNEDDRYGSCADFLKALFDFDKKQKSFWQHSDIIYAQCKRKNIFYRIIQEGKHYKLQTSKDQKKWRKKSNGPKADLIKEVAEHNK